jgi:syntaxin-binding protein 1
MFPFVKDAPSQANFQASLRSPPPQTSSLRSQKPAWHRAPQRSAISDNKQRVIVFFAGGVTYSEMREAYQLSTSLNRDVIIGRLSTAFALLAIKLTGLIPGSTHTITPNQLVDDLKVLDLGGAGSKAIPNGLRDRKDGPRPFQDAYDEKYYTRDPPPPTRAPPAPAPSARMRAAAPPMQPSPTNSYHGSSNSISQPEEKKKKRGFFGFK